MSPTQGSPKVMVRVEDDVLKKAKLVFPPVKGRSGGVAHALRRLLFLVLGLPMPRQFGEIGRSYELDALEARFDELEQDLFDRSQAAEIRERVRTLLATAGDAVDILRLRALLGRLQLWERPLDEQS